MSWNTRICMVPALVLAALAACGTTRRFVEQPPLTVDDAAEDGRRAAAELFDLPPPYVVRICEADAASKACVNAGEGIKATGVGGLILPLTLHVTALTVSRQAPAADGWDIDADFRSEVDAVAPMCRTAHGRIVRRDNNTLALRFDRFYCNWLVVGNVLVFADLSIDSIRPRDKVFTGYYRMSFHGIGNALGSGYFRAEIVRPGPA